MNKEELKEYTKKYHRIWQQNNRKKLRKIQKRYYEKNKKICIFRIRRWQLNNPEYYEKRRKKNPHYVRDWIKNNAKKASIIFRRYREKNQEKIKAQRIANKAYPVKQICSVIGCNKIGEKHHPDYSKPLEIIWLCRKHHKELHNNKL